jgi:ferric-dicitrate binding protein FerR (iron transport regulator)
MWSVPVPGSTEESMVRLEGTATITVSDASGALLVVTAPGEVSLAPGRYTIATEDSSAVRVSVERGLAHVRGRESDDTWFPVGPGQRIRVPRQQR